MTKNEISRKFTGLNKYGFTVLCFQANRKHHGSFKGMTDLLVIDSCRGMLLFIEIKTVSDRVSDIQKQFKSTIDLCNKNNAKVIHLIATEENADNIAGLIYQKKYQVLSTFNNG